MFIEYNVGDGHPLDLAQLLVERVAVRVVEAVPDVLEDGGERGDADAGADKDRDFVLEDVFRRRAERTVDLRESACQSEAAGVDGENAPSSSGAGGRPMATKASRASTLPRGACRPARNRGPPRVGASSRRRRLHAGNGSIRRSRGGSKADARMWTERNSSSGALVSVNGCHCQYETLGQQIMMYCPGRTRGVFSFLMRSSMTLLGWTTTLLR